MMIDMHAVRKWLLRTLYRACSLVIVLVIIPVVGQFSIEIASEYGWYENPSRKVASITEFASDLASSP